MNANAPARIRKVKPLRDVKPPRRSFHLNTYGTFPQYNLLIQTVRKTLFGGHLPAWLTYENDPEGKQRVSPWMNDLIEMGVCQCGHLLQRGVTLQEKAFLVSVGDWQDDYDALVPLPDKELVKGAKSTAGKLILDQKIIRRPYKRYPDGTRVFRKGKPVKGYTSELRAAQHTREATSHDEPLAPLVSPLENYASGVTGKVYGITSTADLARGSTNEMVDRLMNQGLAEQLAACIGEDLEWLLAYYDRTETATPADRQRASRLLQRLREHKEDFQDYLT